MKIKPALAIASTLLPTLVCSWDAAAASADTYPTRPIRVVTAPAGAGNDFMARVISQALSANLGQQLVVDNRPAGIIGEIVAKAPPDGYTLLAVGSVLWLTPFLQDTVGYDPVKDFAPIAVTARAVNILVVHPSIGTTSVKELLAFIRSKPGQLNCASGATGSSNHLAAELFRSMSGVDFVRIPYKGSGPALNDLLSGQVQMMFPTSAAGLPHVKSGRLRALAVTSLKPSTLAPGLPTVSESGVPGYESVVMYALFAPAKTPANIVNKLQSELAQSLKSPASVEKLAAAGVEPVASTPRELAEAMNYEMTRLGKIIKEARLRSQ